MPSSPLAPDELQRAVDQANEAVRAIARDRRHNPVGWRARYDAAVAHYNAAVEALGAQAREANEEPALAA